MGFEIPDHKFRGLQLSNVYSSFNGVIHAQRLSAELQEEKKGRQFQLSSTLRFYSNRQKTNKPFFSMKVSTIVNKNQLSNNLFALLYAAAKQGFEDTIDVLEE